MHLQEAVPPSPKRQHLWLSSGAPVTQSTVRPHTSRSQARCFWFGQSYRLVLSWGQVLSLRGCLEMSGYNFGCLGPRTVKKERQRQRQRAGHYWSAAGRGLDAGKPLTRNSPALHKDYLVPKLKVWKFRNFSQVDSQDTAVRIMITRLPTTLGGELWKSCSWQSFVRMGPFPHCPTAWRVDPLGSF